MKQTSASPCCGRRRLLTRSQRHSVRRPVSLLPGLFEGLQATGADTAADGGGAQFGSGSATVAAGCQPRLLSRPAPTARAGPRRHRAGRRLRCPPPTPPPSSSASTPPPPVASAAASPSVAASTAPPLADGSGGTAAGPRPRAAASAAAPPPPPAASAARAGASVSTQPAKIAAGGEAGAASAASRCPRRRKFAEQSVLEAKCA